MLTFSVTLKGFFGETRYTMTTAAKTRAHAVRIVSAIYDDCWNKAEVKEIV